MHIFQEKIRAALESSNPEDFNFKDCIIGGDECVLVTPKAPSVKWTQKNKYLRSVIYRKSDYYPISLGFFKFTNWGENPESFPPPRSLDGSAITTKIDGSLLILSNYKGEEIIRTRGTVSARSLDSGFEIDILKKKYPNVFEEEETSQHSYLFEWTGSNKIVLDYTKEPEIVLIGAVDHENYSLVDQKTLDAFAYLIGVKRPEYHSFKDIPALLEEVKKWEGREGICLYTPDDQIFKVKAAKYLLLHSLKSEIGSFKKMVEMWFTIGKPDFNGFYNYIKDNFDFEFAESARKDMEKIKNVQSALQWLKEEIAPLKTLPRKEAASIILANYTELSGPAFSFLDGKEISDKMLEKLILTQI